MQFCADAGSSFPGLWYGPAPCLGRHTTPRRRLLPFAAIALVVLAAPALGLAGSTQSASTLRTENAAARGEVAGCGARASIRSTSGSARPGRASTRSQRAGGRAPRRARRASRSSCRSRGAATASRSSTLAARLRLLYEQGERRAARDRLRREEPRRGAHEPRQPEPGDAARARTCSASSKRGHAATSRRAAQLAAREAALAAATAQARGDRDALRRRARRAAPTSARSPTQRRLNDAPDLGARRAGAGGARRRARSVQARSTAPPPRPSRPRAAATRATPPPAPARAAGRSPSSRPATRCPARPRPGCPVGWGVVAVDPSVIPLGTHMTIPGYGEAVAADTGGAVVGATIDLWFPTVAQANAWGRRTVTIVLH